MLETVDLRGSGLGIFLLPYQEEAVHFLYAVGEATSFQVWDYLKNRTPVSRASVINSLNGLVKADAIAYREETGKGGYRRVYSPKDSLPTLESFTMWLVRRVTKRLSEEFGLNLIQAPEETS